MAKKTILSEEKKNELRNLSIKDIFKSNKEKVSNLLKTNLGGKKESIYKSSIFEDMSDRQKSKYRGKIRNYFHNYFVSILAENNNENLSKLVSSFDDFYNSVCIKNDYSFESISSDNAKEENKQIINSGLSKIKAFKAKELANKKAKKEERKKAKELAKVEEKPLEKTEKE